MGKRIFASHFSRRKSGEISSNDTIGIGFDEVYLDCGECLKKTLQVYKGYFKNPPIGETKFNYECRCGRINVFNERK